MEEYSHYSRYDHDFEMIFNEDEEDEERWQNPIKALILDELSNDEETPKQSDEYVKKIILENLDHVNSQTSVSSEITNLYHQRSLLSMFAIQARTKLMKWFLTEVPYVDPNCPLDSRPLMRALELGNYREARLLMEHPKIQVFEMFDSIYLMSGFYRKLELYAVIALYRYTTREEFDKRTACFDKGASLFPTNGLYKFIAKYREDPQKLRAQVIRDEHEALGLSQIQEEDSAQLFCTLVLLNDQLLAIKEEE